MTIRPRLSWLVVPAVVAAAGATALALPAGGATALAVSGTVFGTYTAVTSNPDTGHHYSVKAHGPTTLGSTTATGTVAGPGNVQSGHCTAHIVFTTSKGSITASLTSTKSFSSFASCQSGFAFTWHSTKATGSYAGESASGKGTLTLVKASNASSNPPPAYITLDKS